MEVSDAFTADLAFLAEALDEPDPEKAFSLREFNAACATAVGSYLGFSVTVVVAGVSVRFSTLDELRDPSEIRTSLMVPLSVLRGHAAAGHMVLYAGTAGAFVDLAADLAYLLGTRPEVVQLDQHLTPPAAGCHGAGLKTLSQRNQAIGVLLEHGFDRDEALAELRRRAAHEGISVHTAARRILDSVTQPPASPSIRRFAASTAERPDSVSTRGLAARFRNGR